MKSKIILIVIYSVNSMCALLNRKLRPGLFLIERPRITWLGGEGGVGMGGRGVGNLEFKIANILMLRFSPQLGVMGFGVNKTIS